LTTEQKPIVTADRLL